MLVNNTNAKGELIAFSLQVFYALYLLCKTNENGVYISVEVFDDVAKQQKNEIELSQLKSSTSSFNPISNSSIDFWKTIYNWCQIDSENKMFRYVAISGRSLKHGSVVDSFNNAKSKEEVEEAYKTAIEELNKLQNNNASFLKHKIFLQNPSNSEIIKRIIKNFNLETFEDNFVDKMNEAFCAACLNDEHYEEIKKTILGWIWEYILDAQKDDKAIVFLVDDFKKAIGSEIKKYGKRLIVDTNFTEEERCGEETKYPNYIKQLELINESDDTKRDAIANYIIEKKNVDKWINALDIDRDEYNNYKNCIITTYKDIKEIEMLNNSDDISKGKTIFHKLNKDATNAAKLNGESVDYRIVRGTIQNLSNELLIGWHPDYLNKIKKDDE